MKFYGHANLQQNELQNAVLSTLTSFPNNPVVGQVAFVNSIVYICVRVTPAPPIWVPLTQEITAYTHVQGTASASWSITHNLNTTDVNIQVYNNANQIIIPDEITITGVNTATVTFAALQQGKAVVLSGHFTGNQKPTYSYTHYQNTASATWTIDHALGYNPIVRVFIGTSEVQPASITHPTANQTVITFSTPQVGYARLI
jgi:hypothetical protein